ncbi:MAG: hypothetical protein AAF215_21310 [Cyanobacteria bacterium P01_A01_bin.123]
MSLMNDDPITITANRCIRLPEPDADNITVLTENLPNQPILPWHHYDSPWLEEHRTIANPNDKQRNISDAKGTDDVGVASETSEQNPLHESIVDTLQSQTAPSAAGADIDQGQALDHQESSATELDEM